MSSIKVKLVHSLAGRTPDQLATVKGLGLRKLGDEKVLPDNACTLGMCQKLHHMVVWERVDQPFVKNNRPRPTPSKG